MARRTLRHHAHRSFGTIAAAGYFTLIFATSLVLHGDLPATRRFAAGLTTTLLGRIFEGQVQVHKIDHIGFDGVDIGAVEIIDPWGKRVLGGQGLHVQTSVLRVVRGLLGGAINIELDEVRVDEADVDLEPGPDGRNRVAAAFTPRPKPGPPEPPTPPGAAKPLRIALPRIVIGHGWAHGAPVEALPLDVEGFRMPGALLVTHESVAIDVERFGLRGSVRPPFNPSGTADYHLRVTRSEPPRMWTSYTGYVGDVAVGVSASLEGAELKATVDAPHVAPIDLQSLAPGVEVFEELSAHAVVSGTLPDVLVTARAVGGSGEIRVGAEAHLGSPFRLIGDWHVRDLDPRFFSRGAPPASLGGDGRLALVIDVPKIEASLDATTYPFTVNGQFVPGVVVHATYGTGMVKGHAVILEPGVAASADFSVAPGGIVQIDGEAQAHSLGEVTRLGGILQGEVKAKVTGRFDPATGIEASVEAGVRSLKAAGGKVGLDVGTVRGRLHGAPQDLQLDSSLDGRGLLLGGLVVAGVRGHATGPLLRPLLGADLTDPRWQKLSLQAAVRPGPGFALGGIKATVRAGDVATTAEVRTLSVGPAGLRLEGIEVSGAVAAHGHAQLSAGGLAAQIAGEADLVALSSLLPGVTFAAGKASFDLDIQGEGTRRQGRVKLAVKDGQVALVPLKASGEVELSLAGNAVTAKGEARVATPSEDLELATVALSADGQLPGSLLAPHTYAAATGEGRVDSLRVDLDRLFASKALELARMKVPSLPEVRGELLARMALRRDVAGSLAGASLDLETRGLQVTLPPGEPAAKGPLGAPLGPPVPGLAIRDVDLRSSLSFAPVAAAPGVKTRAGHEEAAIKTTTQLLTGGTVLATLLGSAEAEAGGLFADLKQVSGRGAESGEAFERLWALPVTLQVSWVERAFDSLPALIRPPGVQGRSSGLVSLAGSLARPKASLQVKVDALRAEAGAPWAVRGSFDGDWGSEGASLIGKLEHATPEGDADKGGESAQVLVSSKVSLADVLRLRPAARAWTLDGEVRLDRWLLEAVPQVAELGLTGRVSGRATVTQLHGKPSFGGQLSLDEGRLFDAELGHTEIYGGVTEGSGVVNLEMTQTSSEGEGGKLALAFFPSLVFVNGLRPRLAGDGPQLFSLRARHFDLEPFSPLATPFVADLRGNLDGEMTLSVGAPPARGAAPPIRLTGGLAWSEGVVLIPQLGQTFTGGRLAVTARTEGEQTNLDVSDLSLAATTGRITGKGSIRIPAGFIEATLLGTTRKGRGDDRLEGTMEAQITPEEKIPVTFEGVALGDAFGRTEARIAIDPRGTELTVAVPRLTFELPESTGQKSVQDLGANPDLGVIGRAHRPGAPTVARGKRDFTVKVGLGSSLAEMTSGAPPASPSGLVVVRRAGLDVRLSGATVIELGDTFSMTGTIETLSGRVLAMGKPFEVQRGLVRFDGQAGNPFLNVGASWDAPDGTHVVAELVGYLKQVKLRLRSEPARPENEVLALVLFGRDPKSSGLPGENQNQADSSLAVGSGVASTLLNSFIDPVQVFGRRIETRVDNSASRGTSIGIATEIRPRIWAQVDVSTARQQDRQNADLSAVTLDWRFRPGWSLRTTVGDRGSSLMELLWQLRY
jgi:translocation and assembly module TamB